MRTLDPLTWLSWLPCVLGGIALGLFFFGGLWWTVRAIVGSARLALLQFASLALRTAVTLGGFHVIGGGDAGRLVACLAGFVLARAVVARRLRQSAPVASPGGPR